MPARFHARPMGCHMADDMDYQPPDGADDGEPQTSSTDTDSSAVEAETISRTRRNCPVRTAPQQTLMHGKVLQNRKNRKSDPTRLPLVSRLDGDGDGGCRYSRVPARP